MNRNPTKGDVVAMNGKRVEYLVTDSGLDTLNANAGGYGTTYDWFTAIKSTVTNPITGAIDGGKEKTYCIRRLDNQVGGIPLSEIQLLATAKFKKVVTVEYFITKTKDV